MGEYSRISWTHATFSTLLVSRGCGMKPISPSWPSSAAAELRGSRNNSAYGCHWPRLDDFEPNELLAVEV